MRHVLFLSVALLTIASAANAIPNPSAVFCEQCGYDYQMRDGGSAVCVFPDGGECEAWAFWRKCNGGLCDQPDCGCYWPCIGPVKIISVDDDANGPGDGTSWSTAYRFLQDALAQARSSTKPVEIRVAQGIYKPDRGTSEKLRDRNATFQLLDDVTIKGGYAGIGSADPNARDVDKYQTILSGDLDANDVDLAGTEWQNIDDLIRWGSRKDNSYSVVTGSGTDRTAVLDGLTITAGQADGADGPWDGPQVNGAGMYNHHGNPTISNCTFLRNTTCGYDRRTGGAGLFNSDSNPALRDCTFIENIAFGANGLARGGGMFDVNSAPILTNCVFRNNIVTGYDSDYYGGAAYEDNSRSTFANCLFIHNSGEGGAIQLACSDLKLSNCTWAGNGNAVSCDHWGCGQPQTSSLEAVNCIIWDGIGVMPVTGWFEIRITYSDVRDGWLGQGNISVDPCFAQAGYWDNNGTPDEPWDDFWVEGGDYHLKSQTGRWDPTGNSNSAGGTWVNDDVTSPCIDAGDPASPIGYEPFPSGGRINMGAYGGTAEASKSYFGKPVCETIVAGDINGDCKVDFTDFAIMASHWLQTGL